MSARLYFYGFEEYAKQCQRLGVSMDAGIEEALSRNGKRITKELTAGLAKYTSRHHRRSHSTGTTRENILRDPPERPSRGLWELHSGFHLPDGLPGRYIAKGGVRKNRGRMPRGGFANKALSEQRAQDMFDEILKEFEARGGK